MHRQSTTLSCFRPAFRVRTQITSHGHLDHPDQVTVGTLDLPFFSPGGADECDNSVEKLKGYQLMYKVRMPSS